MRGQSYDAGNGLDKLLVKPEAVETLLAEASAAADPAAFDNLDHEKAVKVMAAMDEANRRWGRATVVPAAVGIGKNLRS